MYDGGLNPNKVKTSNAFQADEIRQELVTICYVCMKLNGRTDGRTDGHRLSVVCFIINESSNIGVESSVISCHLFQKSHISGRSGPYQMVIIIPALDDENKRLEVRPITVRHPAVCP